MCTQVKICKQAPHDPSRMDGRRHGWTCSEIRELPLLHHSSIHWLTSFVFTYKLYQKGKSIPCIFGNITFCLSFSHLDAYLRLNNLNIVTSFLIHLDECSSITRFGIDPEHDTASPLLDSWFIVQKLNFFFKHSSGKLRGIVVSGGLSPQHDCLRFESWHVSSPTSFPFLYYSLSNKIHYWVQFSIL